MSRPPALMNLILIDILDLVFFKLRRAMKRITDVQEWLLEEEDE